MVKSNNPENSEDTMNNAEQSIDNVEISQSEKKKPAADINRFYYRKLSTTCKRSSLSLDIVLVELLVARFGSMPKLRKWIAAQAKIAQNDTQDDKSISRTVQENAIRVIADPALLSQLSDESRSEAERQSMMVLWLGQGQSGKKKKGKTNQKHL